MSEGARLRRRGKARRYYYRFADDSADEHQVQRTIPAANLNEALIRIQRIEQISPDYPQEGIQ